MADDVSVDMSSIEAFVRGIVQQMMSSGSPSKADTVKTGAGSRSNELREEARAEAELAERNSSAGSVCEKDGENIAPGLAAFKIYWDDDAQSYKMRQPAVSLPDGSTVYPDPPNVQLGTSYYLHVCWFAPDEETGTEEEYKAEVSDSGEEGEFERDADKKWIIPIATVGAVERFGFVTQHHVGVVNVSASSGGQEIPDPPSGFYWQQVTVVVKSEYSTSDGRFVNKTKDIWVLSPSDGDDDEVFTTIPHSSIMDE